MRVLFVDRDGTLIREPSDYQIDSFEKLSFLPGAICALRQLVEAGYHLVMVTNQDGLGTQAWPESRFWPVHNFVMSLLAGEGIAFEGVFIDRHFAHENHPNRKPGTGMLTDFLATHPIDMAASYVIGDRKTDAQLAHNLGCRSITIKDGLSYDGDAKPTGDAPVPEVPTVHVNSWAEITRLLLAPS